MDSTSKEKAEQSRPNQRRNPRTRVPSIKIRCDSKLYVPQNWGLGGCLISNYNGQLRPGTTVLIELFLNVVHEHDGLPVKAEVVRFDPDDNSALALRFADLSAQDIIDFCEAVDENLSAEVINATM
jgi:hypothetical protein